ncbi:hypothetical protein FN846DRAFT_172818 [Sphaerosporella brunnea]|uniref:Uncharacterized protein n=1 Tax=Sphaerosporella brunnea TaxID=1250544 RepID=A0A5J5EPA3_9PEZI|nr:hypothetical protein FN846DRAFT_172818 [Sphaerosporella brunnea]
MCPTLIAAPLARLRKLFFYACNGVPSKKRGRASRITDRITAITGSITISARSNRYIFRCVSEHQSNQTNRKRASPPHRTQSKVRTNAAISTPAMRRRVSHLDIRDTTARQRQCPPPTSAATLPQTSRTVKTVLTPSSPSSSLCTHPLHYPPSSKRSLQATVPSPRPLRSLPPHLQKSKHANNHRSPNFSSSPSQPQNLSFPRFSVAHGGGLGFLTTSMNFFP